LGIGSCARDRAGARLQPEIETLWRARSSLTPDDREAREIVRRAVDLLDSGRERIADVDPDDGGVVVHEWLVHAVTLVFRLFPLTKVEVGPFEYLDRIPLKRDFTRSGARVVPGGIVRWGAFLDRGAIVMPGFVNIGARIGSGSMVDTWATVGSCAQVGKNVHLSGGVGIGGMLEPLQPCPVIIDDDAFIGSRSMVTEGARVGRGAVLGQGVILSGSIPVVDAESGDELSRGEVPPWCVAVGATRARRYGGGEWGMPCVLVVRRLAEGERHEKAALNDLVRDHAFAL
jgi:2,3,4,5-tetrahydropyridine-2,6-dicarboxylate N-succinyltransferase